MFAYIFICLITVLRLLIGLGLGSTFKQADKYQSNLHNILLLLMGTKDCFTNTCSGIIERERINYSGSM